MEDNFPELLVDWEWLQEYVECLEPIWMATLQLQQQQLVLSDVFKIWMEVKLLYANSACDLKTQLHNCLNERESLILENVSMLSAIFLDPRLNLILNNNQKTLAKTHLKQIAKNLLSIKQVQD